MDLKALRSFGTAKPKNDAGYREPAGGRVQAVDEPSLIRASQKGSVEAFNRLVLKWERPIYNLCLRMMKHDEDAADATQDVFLKAFRAIRTFRLDSNFSTWLYRIAANECFTRLGKRRFQPPWSLDDEESRSAIDSRLPRQESHEHGYLQAEAGVHVQKALQKLAPEQRMAVELKFFQERTFEEMAEILQVPLSTAKSRLYQGLEILKRHLKGFGGGTR